MLIALNMIDLLEKRGIRSITSGWSRSWYSCGGHLGQQRGRAFGLIDRAVSIVDSRPEIEVKNTYSADVDRVLTGIEGVLGQEGGGSARAQTLDRR